MSKNSLKKSLLCWFVYVIVRLLHATYRYRYYEEHHYRAAKNLHPHGSMAMAAWHRNCFVCIMAHVGEAIGLLVSRSTDGDLISFAGGRLGFQSVRGSSSRGGRAALDEIIEKGHKGFTCAFAVDGPRGPIYEVKAGAIKMASETGSPILPLAAIAEKSWVLHKSWDRFRLPKPFSVITVVYGEPIKVPAQLKESAYLHYQQKVADALHLIEEKTCQIWQEAKAPSRPQPKVDAC